MHLLPSWLAQASGLPKPDALDRFLFEQPLPAAAAAFALGVFLLVGMNRRGRAGRGTAALAVCVAIGGGIWLAGALVTTEREMIQARTLRVVDATIDADGAAVRGLTASDLEFSTINSGAVTLDRELFLSAVASFDEMGISSHVRSIRGASVDGPHVGRVDCFVRVSGSGGLYGGGITPSVWRFHWRKTDAGQWLLYRLECLSMFGREPGRNTLDWARRLAN